MSDNLVVDDQNQLREVRISETPLQPAYLRILAKIISFVFHPLFIPVYLISFYIKSQPYLFSSFTPQERWLLVLRFAIIYIMFPLFTTLLLKALGFVKSIYLKTQRERVFAYIICMVYYWWMWYVLHNQHEYPNEIVMLALAVFLVSILGLMANIIMKVSMHAMAAGTGVTFLMLIALSQDINYTVYVSFALLITGIICTARLIASDHTTNEVYTGLAIGIISQIIAYWFV